MSTITAGLLCRDEIERYSDLHAFVCVLEGDSSLFLRGQLRKRLIALDEIDAGFGGFDSENPARCADSRLQERAKVLRMRLEAVNRELYGSVRSDIVRGGEPRALLQWLEDVASEDERRGVLPGLGFDSRDELVSGVLQVPAPGDPNLELSMEMVPYQPTPVRHILDLIAAAGVAEDDVFVDLGSGLGHVPLLVSLVTGARSVGVEVEAAYVASAQGCAESLRLGRVQFIAQDARDADLSQGSVFYLYSPFKGSILDEVLEALRRESLRRAIKICSLGPCTERVSSERWLKARGLPDTGRIAVFDSHEPVDGSKRFLHPTTM